MTPTTFTAAITALRATEDASELHSERKIVFHHPSTYATVSFDEYSVHSLPVSSKQNVTTLPLLFVDGGNSLIFQSASSCLALLRFAALRYDGLVKHERIIHECFVLITREKERDSVRYFNELPFFQNFSLREEQSNNSGLHTPNDWVAQINKLRRFQELCLVEHLHQQYPTSTIVLDGSLDSDDAKELALIQKWQQQQYPLFAFSKSSTLLTLDNKSVLAQCASLFQQKLPHRSAFVVDDTQTLFFARLHTHSSHVFRIDTTTKESTSLLQILAVFSSDPVFWGYPYPLIEVDRMARVSNEECNYYRTMLGTKIDIRKFESSVSAHAVLDKIMF